MEANEIIVPALATPPPWRSAEIGALAKALAAFQAEVKDPARKAENPFFGSKYADLQALEGEVRALLAKHDLSHSQLVETTPGFVTLRTLVLHTSGQWLMSVSTWACPPDIQKAGSIITYLRRYSLGAILGVASEADDDGNAGKDQKKPEPPPPDRMTRKQIDDAFDAAHAAFGLSGDELRARVKDCAALLGLPTAAECTYAQGETLIAELRKHAAEQPPATKPKASAAKPASDKQNKMLHALAAEVFPERGDALDRALKALGEDLGLPSSRTDYTSADASKMIERLQEMKAGGDALGF
jgi:hypothetical protein